jgi:hypothetical protein
MAKKKVAKKTATKRPRGAIPTTMKLGRYDNVVFEFHNSGASPEFRGTVVIRKDAMVLEIPKQDGYAESLVVGKPHKHFFRGSNSSRAPDAVSCEARWADLGDEFAGIWQDDDYDSLFKFRLPKK